MLPREERDIATTQDRDGMWVETRALDAERADLFGCHQILALDGSSASVHRRSKTQANGQVFDTLPHVSRTRAHRSNPPPPRSGPWGRGGRGTGMTMLGPFSRSRVSWRSLIVSRTDHARRSANTSLLR